MFPSYILSNPQIEIIKDFVIGKMSIADFMAHYNASDDMPNYLNSIIDYIEKNNLPIKRRIIFMKNVAMNQPFEAPSAVESYIKEYAQRFIDLSDEWKANPPKVGEKLKYLSHLTAYGASEIHNTVADIYYQIDQSLERTTQYFDQYAFTLEVLPGYLSGGISAENYVSQYILPKYPATMKKGERKRLIREEIKTTFLRDCKGYPRWLQAPEWPIGSDEKPMVYTGQKSFGNYSEYYFRDAVTNEKHTVTQWW